MIKILGITDAVTTCDCCGKSNLKKTVGLEMEDGTQLCYGSACAAKTLSKMSSFGKLEPVTSSEIINLAKLASYYKKTDQVSNVRPLYKNN